MGSRKTTLAPDSPPSRGPADKQMAANADTTAARLAERLHIICQKVRNGTYFIPTEKLAPILERIVTSLGAIENRN